MVRCRCLSLSAARDPLLPVPDGAETGGAAARASGEQEGTGETPDNREKPAGAEWLARGGKPKTQQQREETDAAQEREKAKEEKELMAKES